MDGVVDHAFEKLKETTVSAVKEHFEIGFAEKKFHLSDGLREDLRRFCSMSHVQSTPYARFNVDFKEKSCGRTSLRQWT